MRSKAKLCLLAHAFLQELRFRIGRALVGTVAALLSLKVHSRVAASGAKVKTLVAQMQRSGAQWQKGGCGWEVMESTLRLTGWSHERRVVLVREAPALAPAGENARRRRDCMQVSLPGSSDWQNEAAPWVGKIAVLVTTLDPLTSGAGTVSPPVLSRRAG